MPTEVIVEDSMPSETYHRDPAPQPSLSASIAKILDRKSPLHAWTANPRLNPNYQDSEKEIFDLGTAAHSLLLEGIDKMVEMPFDDWRKKEAREQRDLVRRQGKLPVLSKYVSDIYLMIQIAKKALADSELGLDLSSCFTERSIFWQQDGIWKRARLDAQSRQHHLILDYKSTDEADPYTFQRQIINLGYDIQAAHYCDAYRAAVPTCDRDPTFVFLVQERSAPFACSLVGVDPVFLGLGQQKIERAGKIWKRCNESNSWPSYSKSIFWAEPPAWALADFERRSLGEQE
jgi:hypothetical protein